MKKKFNYLTAISLLFINLSFLVVVSNNAFAHSGHGYRVLSEQIVGNAPNFKFTDVTDKKKGMHYESIRVSTSNVNSKINEQVKVKGYHSINIYNLELKKRKYNYKYMINCGGLEKVFMSTVEVDGGGHFSNDYTSEIELQFKEPGSYYIVVHTTLSETLSGYKDVTDNAIITIIN